MQSLIKLALLAVTILPAGCRPPPEPLRIVSSPWAGYEPLYLARDLGYLSEDSVRITELPSSNLNMEAFSNGSTDLSTLTLDETLTLLTKGQKPRILLVLLNSSRIPDEIFDLIVVREDVYQTRRDGLCHLAQQWFRTLDYIEANQKDAYARMDKRLGTNEEDFRTARAAIKVPLRQENQQLLGGNTPTLLAPARRLADIMQRGNMIPGPVDIAAGIDPGFANRLQLL